MLVDALLILYRDSGISAFSVPLPSSEGSLARQRDSHDETQETAQMVESVDTRDLNSLGQLRSCGFKSRSGYLSH